MKKVISLVLIVVLLAASYRLGQQSVYDKDNGELNFSVANEVWSVINDKYLRADEIDQDELKYGLAKGLVNSLGDQHSSFFDPEESEAFLTSLQGELQGIGAELKLVEGAVVVVSPLPGSPAESAGLLPGDVILKIGDEHLGVVNNLLEIVMKIRGPKGTDVSLTVLHEENPVPAEITITRDEIHLDAVRYDEHEYKGEKVAVLTITAFTEQVEDEFAKLLRQVNFDGNKHLVIDLRYNGGGYLEAAIDIASYFIEGEQAVLHIKEKDDIQARMTRPKALRYDGNIVVLINDSSASASEIVAGALKEYGKAHLIGVQSYGKGTVQEVHPFFDHSLMRITVAEWLTPNKKSIEKTGIEPDEIVELDYQAFREGNDNQLEAAFEYLTR